MTPTIPIEEVLYRLNLESDNEKRKELDRELVTFQQTQAALFSSIGWLYSLNYALQFFASQTLLWHVRENWKVIPVTELADKLIPITLANDYPSPVRRKLSQVIGCMAVNAFPMVNIIEIIFNHAKANGGGGGSSSPPPLQMSSSIILEVLLEVPHEIERLPSLSNNQYAFKHYLEENSLQVLEFICSILTSNDDASTLSSSLGITGLECFSAWCTIKSFRKQVFNTERILILFNLLRHQSLREEATSAIITWLESGVEDLPLKKLIFQVNSMSLLLFEAVNEKNVDFLTLLTKIFRLYGELIVDDLIIIIKDETKNEHERKSYDEFIQILIGLTEVERQFFPLADISLFWITFSNAVLCHGRRSPEAINYLTVVLSRSILSPLTMGTKFDKGYKVYRDSLVEVLLELYSVLGPTFLETVQMGLLSGRPREVRVALWALGTVSKLLKVEEELPRQILSCTIELKDQVEYQLALLMTWRKAGHILRASPQLLERLSIVKMIFNPDTSKSALETLNVIMNPIFDKEILDSIPLLLSLAFENQELFWSIACQAIGRQNHKDTMIKDLCSFLSTFIIKVPQNLSPNSIGMLEQLIRQTQLTVIPDEVLNLIVKCFPNNDQWRGEEEGICKINQMLTAAALSNLWVTVINVLGPLNPKLISELVHTLIPTIIVNSFNAEMVPVIDAALYMFPSFTPLVMDLVERVIMMTLDDNDDDGEFWPHLLYLLNKTLKIVNVTPIPPKGIHRMVWPLLERIISSPSTNDDHLRSVIRFIEIMVKNFEPSDQYIIFYKLFQAVLNERLLESQVDIIGPLLLELIQMGVVDPLIVSRALEEKFPQRSIIIKKLMACRLPRHFSRLLLQFRS